ncbi:hypothetical protein BGZ95_002016 [Linnemannia exigua]|uniref:Uncharacterized protein n=1 Tax=Linnemannia exigua TaxID=604196 RepID=A0AAD4D6N5_9FUNG|nr:hypothetical protein BGZ95_002016 [Linnemannia exigua]
MSKRETKVKALDLLSRKRKERVLDYDAIIKKKTRSTVLTTPTKDDVAAASTSGNNKAASQVAAVAPAPTPSTNASASAVANHCRAITKRDREVEEVIVKEENKRCKSHKPTLRKGTSSSLPRTPGLLRSSSTTTNSTAYSMTPSTKHSPNHRPKWNTPQSSSPSTPLTASSASRAQSLSSPKSSGNKLITVKETDTNTIFIIKTGHKNNQEKEHLSTSKDSQYQGEYSNCHKNWEKTPVDAHGTEEKEDDDEVEYELDIRVPERRAPYPPLDTLPRVTGINRPECFQLRSLTRLVTSASNRSSAEIHAPDARLVSKQRSEVEFDSHHPWAQGPVEFITTGYQRDTDAYDDHGGHSNFSAITPHLSFTYSGGKSSGASKVKASFKGSIIDTVSDSGHRKSSSTHGSTPTTHQLIAVAFAHNGRATPVDPYLKQSKGSGTRDSLKPIRSSFRKSKNLYKEDNSFVSIKSEENKENEWRSWSHAGDVESRAIVRFDFHHDDNSVFTNAIPFSRLITNKFDELINQPTCRSSVPYQHSQSAVTGGTYDTEAYSSSQASPLYAAPSFSFPGRKGATSVPLVLRSSSNNGDGHGVNFNTAQSNGRRPHNNYSRYTQ